MNVLTFFAYFTPEKAASIYLFENLVEDLSKTDNVELITPTPSRGISQDEIASYHNKLEETLYDGHCQIHRVKLYNEGTGTIGRFVRYLIGCIKQYWRARKLKNIDVIFSESTPPILCTMAVFVKKALGVPLVYDLQDIFPDSLVSTGISSKGSIFWNIGRKIEDFTYRHCDKIIVISEDFKQNILAKGVPEEKIVVVYNWVDEQAVVDVPRDKNKLFDKYNLDRSKFYIEYSGNIGLTQNMDMLLDVMGELQSSHPDIHLALVGEGAYKSQVEKIVKEKHLNNVVMIPFQPYEDISYVFSLGDAGLVISKPGVGTTCVPSKTWSIMSASRPVLANFDENELKDILAGNECGIFTKAGDKEAFKQSIIGLYENRDLCKKYGDNGRKFVMENLTRAVGTQKYINVLRSTLN